MLLKRTLTHSQMDEHKIYVYVPDIKIPIFKTEDPNNKNCKLSKLNVTVFQYFIKNLVFHLV